MKCGQKIQRVIKNNIISLTLIWLNLQRIHLIIALLEAICQKIVLFDIS